MLAPQSPMPTTLTAPQREVYLRLSQLALPRHTSYPSANMWKDADAGAYRAQLAALSGGPVSVYVHIPYCEKLCYYCACTKLIVPKSHPAAADDVARLMAGLRDEMTMVSTLAGRPVVHQLHFGGGTPTYLDARRLAALFDDLHARFTFAPGAESAVEIDPRVTTTDQLKVLFEYGVRRVSLGVQDFDAKVQSAVNRVQPFPQVARFVEDCRRVGFASINFDLIYGLPHQTLDTVAETLRKTIALGPDRIAFYRLAVIPELFKWQRTFTRIDLPGGETTLAMNLLAIERFQEAGYRFVGLDHFARPDEALAVAYDNGTLVRNFQGMTTGADLPLIGLGPSAIGGLRGAFFQNRKDVAKWAAVIGRGELATDSGAVLSADDVIRQDVIQRLYCYRRLDFTDIARRHGIDFDSYFAVELERLRELERDFGLVELTGSGLRATEPLGALLLRVIASAFDAYLPPDAYRNGVSNRKASKVG